MDTGVDDGAMDNSSQSDDGQGVPHARALQPTARSIAPSMGELKGEALHDFAMACYRRARDKANTAIGAKKARAPAIRQWLRAFGLASNDPENIEEYAIEAGIEPPETLREALGTERGAKIGIAMETQLRNSGELAHVSFARMMHKAVAAVAKGLDDGSVSAAAASKIIDEYGKFRERATEADRILALAAPIPFTGTAEQLVAEILDSNKPVLESKLPWMI